MYSADAEADRAFLRDVLGLAAVDAGHGWLIFALPPAEAAVHPATAAGPTELYLMCDDLEGEIRRWRRKGFIARDTAGRLGSDDADPAAGRRGAGALPAQAPDGAGAWAGRGGRFLIRGGILG